MYGGSLYHGDIISAFQRNVPDCYVRDYRENGGYITLCRGLRSIRWGDQMDANKVEMHVPAITLTNLPKGPVTKSTIYRGLRLERPGWRLEFDRARRHLTERQMLGITEDLGVNEVFPGIVARA